jgi:hypothetical protein
VIEGERKVSLRADCNRVIDHDGNFLDCAHAEDGNLGLIDDRRGEDAAKAAEVGDREGAALNLIGLELTGTCA